MTWQMGFTPLAESVGLVRAQVRRELARRGVSAEITADVILVASELVTNAVLHAGPGQLLVDVALTCRGGDVLVEVTDSCPKQPAMSGTQPGGYAEVEQDGGRGLLLVHALAEAWGVRETGPGKTVWAIMSASGSRVRESC
ncbi:ATP-binding protein [Streptacidiphilus sp. ASG 303]|uniref:ATP-binding protein n=1 Tax=Streptacidiphilus sp. ASG 303 TaxID=2896847 RepID=UPI001E3D1335|nr:ATP-binding protein [Streptacidiphilus sp. ASG 303]MCD0485215.1 ATP-binding protein [Streptacidiphilus sp. ASG 303]